MLCLLCRMQNLWRIATWRISVHNFFSICSWAGDNIDFDSSNATKSLDEAIAPVIAAKIPWAAILGNHDQESTLSRGEVMSYLTQMDYSLCEVLNPYLQTLLLGKDLNPSAKNMDVYGFGNYYLQVFGALESESENSSLLNLYFLDSGDYAKFREVGGYEWIRSSQLVWFRSLSARLRVCSSFGSSLFLVQKPRMWDSVHELKDSAMCSLGASPSSVDAMWQGCRGVSWHIHFVLSAISHFPFLIIFYAVFKCVSSRKAGHIVKASRRFTAHNPSTGIFPHPSSRIQDGAWEPQNDSGWATRRNIFSISEFRLVYGSLGSRRCEGHLCWAWSCEWLLWKLFWDPPMFWGWHRLPCLWVGPYAKLHFYPVNCNPHLWSARHVLYMRH